MRLFDGITLTHSTRASFFAGLEALITDLDVKHPPHIRGLLDVSLVRRCGCKWGIPIGGDTMVDPIHAAVDAGRRNASAVSIVVRFESAWEHYLKVCKAEGRALAA